MIIHRLLGGLQDLLFKGWQDPNIAKTQKEQQTRGNSVVEVNYINIDTIPYIGKLGDPDFKSIRDYIDEHSSGSGQTGYATRLNEITFTSLTATPSNNATFEDFKFYNSNDNTFGFFITLEGSNETEARANIHIKDINSENNFLINLDNNIIIEDIIGVYLNGIQIPMSNITRTIEDDTQNNTYKIIYNVNLKNPYQIVHSNINIGSEAYKRVSVRYTIREDNNA